MKILSIIIFCFSFIGNLQAQKQADIWYFGFNGESGMDFNYNPPTVLRDGKISTDEGTAVMSNSSGNLLFYTDGMTVFNRLHKVVETGLFDNWSSTQSALIVPYPGNQYLYFIFTTDAFEQGEKINKGLNFSILDMRINNGLGGIVLKNQNLFLNSTEKLIALQAFDCENIWVIAHPFGTDEFHSYLVDKNGINPVPVISKTGKPHSIRVGFDIVSRGEIIASPNGKYVANAVSGGDVGGWLELFDFDVETGILNNPKLLSDKIPKDILISGFYSVKFSPDNSKLYAAHYSQPLFQFDLMNLDSPPLQIDPPKVSRLQLAPDGKIYGNLNYPPDGFVYPEDNGKYLCIINKPNELGIECEFVEKGIYLGENAIAHLSLPNSSKVIFTKGMIFQGQSSPLQIYVLVIYLSSMPPVKPI